jgi:hypothetical protein
MVWFVPDGPAGDGDPPVRILPAKRRITAHSTVTLFARFLGLSMSWPSASAV